MAKSDVIIPIGSKKYRPFLQMGLGIASKYGVGAKASLLDLAARYRVSVPPAIILFDTAYQDALADGLLRIDSVDGASKVMAPIPHKLIAALNLPNFRWEFPGPYAIRAAFAREGQPAEGEYPDFLTKLNVDPNETDAFAAALCEVWSSALAYDTSEPDKPLRRDVILMRMVAYKITGTALTENAFEDDWIQQENGASQPLPKLGPGEKTPSTGWRGRLQMLLRDMRRYFGHRKVNTDWAIEWADDGEHCWLLELRPVGEQAHRTPRDEMFLSVLSLLRPLDLPESRLLNDLIAQCSADVYALFQKVDPTLPASRPLIEQLNGRAYLNLSLVSDVVRVWGLASDAITLGESIKPIIPAKTGRMLRKAGALLRWRRTVANTQKLSAETSATITRLEPAETTFAGVLATWRKMLTLLLQVLLVAAAQQNTPSSTRDGLFEAARQTVERLNALLMTRADQVARNGQLPDAAVLWQLSVADATQLDTGAHVTPEPTKQGAAEGPDQVRRYEIDNK